VATIGQAVRASSVAELFWTDPDGAPDGRGVVALTWGETPVVAFTYALETVARAVAAAPLVILTLTDRRSTSTAFEPLALTAHPRMVEDREGDVFVEHLLTEELRRYPPARAFADSVMLRREYWWYLPRLLLNLDVLEARPLPARDSADTHVLAVAGDEGLRAGVVDVTTPQAPAEAVRLRAVGDVAPVAAGPCALVGQDASFPDMERWSGWCYRGRYDGERLVPTQWPAAVGLPPVPSLWQRARRQRAFGRACRDGIRRAERRR
jgi:hypothetical protein